MTYAVCETERQAKLTQKATFIGSPVCKYRPADGEGS